jgi:hypothetical protein
MGFRSRDAPTSDKTLSTDGQSHTPISKQKNGQRILSVQSRQKRAGNAVERSGTPGRLKQRARGRRLGPLAGPQPAQNMHVESGPEIGISGAFQDVLTSQLLSCDGQFLLHSSVFGRRTENRDRNYAADQRARIYSARSMAGRFAADHFRTTFGWRCGLSPATQTSGNAKYREAVLEIANELQSTVSLVRPPRGSDADK